MPLPTKSPARHKARELKLANAAITDMQMLSVMLLRLMKYTKELVDAKAENDALRDDVAAGRRRLQIKQSVSQREATIASGVDNAASPDWQTPLNGIISPQREADHYAKTTEGTQKYIRRAVQIELPISMGNSCNYCEHTHALPAEYKCLK